MTDAFVVAVIPILDDWAALRLMLPRLSAALSRVTTRAAVLIVDDGSRESGESQLRPPPVEGLQWVRILRLRRNLGHQRAIATGLCHVEEHIPCDYVVVIDGDGEDRPEDVPALLARAMAENGRTVVFAERQRRVEGLGFRLGYAVFRFMHRVLTGRGVKVGSFSVLPRQCVGSLTVVSELWIHYAAAVVRSRQPWCAIPLSRAPRLEGRSRMNFVGLVVHGLSAISVYSDVVFTRLIMASAALVGLTLLGLTAVTAIRAFTSLAIPGWASYVAGILLVIFLQAVSLIASLIFLVLGSRQQAVVIPRRDYAFYVSGVSDLSASASPVP
jgi:hypothetical protein